MHSTLDDIRHQQWKEKCSLIPKQLMPLSVHYLLQDILPKQMSLDRRQDLHQSRNLQKVFIYTRKLHLRLGHNVDHVQDLLGDSPILISKYLSKSMCLVNWMIVQSKSTFYNFYK